MCKVQVPHCNCYTYREIRALEDAARTSTLRRMNPFYENGKSVEVVAASGNPTEKAPVCNQRVSHQWDPHLPISRYPMQWVLPAGFPMKKFEKSKRFKTSSAQFVAATVGEPILLEGKSADSRNIGGFTAGACLILARFSCPVQCIHDRLCSFACPAFLPT